MKNFIKEELSGWKKSEVLWLLLACTIITCLSVYWGDSLMGIISATTGVACVVCTGKGKLSAYIFGLINAVLYGLIALKAGYYGEVSLNLFYYVPMQFLGFFIWRKNMNTETHEVNKKHMSNENRVLLLFSIIFGTVVYGYILKYIGGEMPFVDSFTTVSSVIAMIISIKMFVEQWWIWIFVNIFSVLLYIIDVINGGNTYATILMWLIYLINAVIMVIKWEKEVRHNENSSRITK